MTIKLNIAKAFSPEPLGRHRKDGRKSGEAFREDILLPEITRAMEQGEILEVDLDGVELLSSSFSEEAFGGLVRERKLSADALAKTLKFVPTPSHFDPYIANIWLFIQKAQRERDS